MLEWFSNYIDFSNPAIAGISIAVIAFIIFDLYHILFNAIFSWFKK